MFQSRYSNQQKDTCCFLRLINMLTKHTPDSLIFISSFPVHKAYILYYLTCSMTTRLISFFVHTRKGVMTAMLLFKIHSWHFLDTPFMIYYCTHKGKYSGSLCLSVLLLSLSYSVLIVYNIHTHTYRGSERSHVNHVRRRLNMPRQNRKQERGENELHSQRFPFPSNVPYFLSHNSPPPTLTLHTHSHIPTKLL